MTDDAPANEWEQELEELFLQVGHRFSRVEPRRRMRDYVRGLLGPVGRKNSWQLAEFAGHSTPDQLQHLLAKSRWEADEIRDDLQGYVAEHLGADDGVLIIDDTGFVKKGVTSAGAQRQYFGTAGRTSCQVGVFAAYATTLRHTLVDRELYRPKSWTDDLERCRCQDPQRARLRDEERPGPHHGPASTRLPATRRLGHRGCRLRARRRPSDQLVDPPDPGQALDLLRLGTATT